MTPFKTKWQRLKYWQKGLLIGLLIAITISAIYFISLLQVAQWDTIKSHFGEKPPEEKSKLSFSVLFTFFTIIVIGIIFGKVMDDEKSSKKYPKIILILKGLLFLILFVFSLPIVGQLFFTDGLIRFANGYYLSYYFIIPQIAFIALSLFVLFNLEKNSKILFYIIILMIIMFNVTAYLKQLYLFGSIDNLFLTKRFIANALYLIGIYYLYKNRNYFGFKITKPNRQS